MFSQAWQERSIARRAVDAHGEPRPGQRPRLGWRVVAEDLLFDHFSFWLLVHRALKCAACGDLLFDHFLLLT
jgi:hypothetical protein